MVVITDRPGASPVVQGGVGPAGLSGRASLLLGVLADVARRCLAPAAVPVLPMGVVGAVITLATTRRAK
jgi:hypothetical protein